MAKQYRHTAFKRFGNGILTRVIRSGRGPKRSVGGVSFLSILATDPPRSAAFSEAVFGRSIWPDPKEPAFEDGTGHVIGFVTDPAVAGEGGVRLHLCRERR